jgi:hypothetical protein
VNNRRQRRRWFRCWWFARPLGLQLSEIIGVTACFVVLDAATAGLRHRRWL